MPLVSNWCQTACYEAIDRPLGFQGPVYYGPEGGRSDRIRTRDLRFWRPPL